MIANWLPRSNRLAFIAGISGCGVNPSQRATWVAWRPSFSSAVSGRTALSPAKSRRTNSGAVRPSGHTAPVPVITPWEDIAGVNSQQSTADTTEAGPSPLTVDRRLWTCRSPPGARENDDRAVSAERERIGQGDFHAPLPGGVGDVVEVARRVGVLVMDRRRDQLVPHGEDRRHAL